jgi:hypothetical protein
MKVKIDSAEMLRILRRHKARTIGDLEDIDCPKGYRDSVRSNLDWLISDMTGLAAGEIKPFEG